MRRIHPDPVPDLSDDEIRAAIAFPEDRPWVRGTFVATLDGAIRGPDGTSRSIATPADQRVFTMLRQAADVILVGAGTLREEDYRPSRLPVAIVSVRLDLPMTLRMFAERTDANPRPLVLTTSASARQAPADLLEAADIVSCGDDSVDIGRVIAELADRGLSRIHCEGGPHLLSTLAEAGLLDELVLTVAPLLLGADPSDHLISVVGGIDPPLRLRITQVLEEDGSIFLRASRQ